jgi:hypothetical protein
MLKVQCTSFRCWSTCLLLLLAWSNLSAASSSWLPVGAVIVQSSIDAVAIEFTDASGIPLIAYGFTNTSSGNATSIYFRQWNVSVGEWSLIASHTPQFAQPYDTFSFRVRGGILYLGLRIDESYDLSSVLRGEGGFDGFEGCYAFSGWTWDFDISSSGDLRAVASPDNASLAIATYGESGWDAYPAGDTWGPFIDVVPAGGPATLNDVVVLRGDNDTLWAAYTTGSNVMVASTTLTNTSVWVPTGGLTAGAGPALAWQPVFKAGTGLLCMSVVSGRGPFNASVQCAVDGAAGGWVAVGTALIGVSNSLPTGIALFPDAKGNTIVLVAAQDGANATLMRTATCSLSNPLETCVWIEVQIPCQQPVNNFQLKAPDALQQPVYANVAPYIVISAGDELDDELRVFTWNST